MKKAMGMALALALVATSACAQWRSSNTNQGRPQTAIDGGTGAAPITRIQLRRDTNANRTLMTPASGECVWTTDTKMLYCGDGSTAGGNMVGVGDSVIDLLDDILDVYAPTPVAGQVLQYGTFNGQSQYGLGKISAANIEADAIIGSKIAADAVDGSKIATGSITSSDIQDSTILGGDIFNGTIAAADIGEDAVGTSELDDGSDTPSAGECVKVASTTSRFEYGSCAGSVVAYDTVEEDGSALTQRDTLNFTGSLITCADGTTKTNCAVSIPAGHVTGSMIQDGSITSDDIGSGAVTFNKLATGSVNTDIIANATISTADFSPGSVDGTVLADGAVNAFKLEADSVTSAKIVDDTITIDDVYNGDGPTENPVLGANKAYWGTYGVTFEGSTSDNFEGALTPSLLTADRLWGLPDEDGLVVVTVDGQISSGDIFDGTITAADAANGELVKNAGVSGGQTIYGGTVAGVNEVQLVTVNATGGTFTLTYSGQTTTAIAYNAGATTVAAALVALSNINQVTCSNTLAAGMSCIFQADLAETNVAQMTGNGANLTGGAATVTVSTSTQGVDGDDLMLTPNSGAANGLIKFGTGAAYDAAEGRLLSGTQTPTASSASEQGGFTSRLSVATSYSTTIPRTAVLSQIEHADTPGIGFGGQWAMQAENAAGTMRTQGRLVWEWSDATDTSEDADMTIECRRGGADADCLKMDADSTELLEPLGSSAFLGGTFTWDPGSIATGANESHSFTCTGAVVGDVVVTAPGFALGTGILVYANATAADTCIVTLMNADTSFSIDPSSSTWKWRVIP